MKYCEAMKMIGKSAIYRVSELDKPRVCIITGPWNGVECYVRFVDDTDCKPVAVFPFYLMP